MAVAVLYARLRVYPAKDVTAVQAPIRPDATSMSAEGSVTAGRSALVSASKTEPKGDAPRAAESTTVVAQVTTAVEESEGGPQERGKLVGGVREGTWFTFRENGDLWMEKHYVCGKLEGLLTIWDENSRKNEEIEYRGGKLNGVATAWYQNGQALSHMHYVDGVRDGAWTIWYANGTVKSEGAYAKGQCDGPCKFYLENGEIDQEASGVFENGVRITGLP